MALLPDELLSSWLVRASLTQGCDPLVLSGEIWPRWRVWITDPDRSIVGERLLPLSRASGISPGAFLAATLLPITSVVNGESPEKKAIWPWMLALGSRNRKRLGGLQFCPQCLAQDPKPYYRLQWRLAWHCGCIRHGCRLMDRCPGCHAALEPHRLLAEDAHLAQCARCKFDFRKGPRAELPEGSPAFQRAADQVAHCGKGFYGRHCVSAAEWFSVARHFVALMRKVVHGKSRSLAGLVASMGVDVEAFAPASTGLPIELLPVQERVLLLAGVSRMMDAGPEGLFEAAREASVRLAVLHDRRHAAPECLRAILAQLPGQEAARRQRRRRSPETGPRSRQSVMRMMARLERKHCGAQE